MTLKEQLILELEDAPETLVEEVLEFTRRLKLEEAEDLADARAALATVATEGTVPWKSVKMNLNFSPQIRRGNLMRLGGIAKSNPDTHEDYVNYLTQKYC